ncbi:MAG: HTTM domain-containing protein [Bacteroidota bacterium]
MAIDRRYTSWSEGLLWKNISIAPLVSLRVLFGFLMAWSIIRFASKGWIEELYVKPQFFFTYYGFDWVQPWGASGMYVLFGLLLLSSLGILFGCFYRLSALSFFLLFTYVEFIDKTNYLNHYYFVSLFSFLLIWVPAHRRMSIDVWLKPSLALKDVPAWTVNMFKFQLGIVYVFAGLAKLNPDWLFRAMPLKLWLPSASDTAIIGPLLDYEWMAYLFSWSGALYDLTIVFFLLYKPTRWIAYTGVVLFHVMTAMLFQIGMFPWIMMCLTLIFFPAESHEAFWRRFGRWWQKGLDVAKGQTERIAYRSFIKTALLAYFLLQLLVPNRFLLYPGSLFWTEQGYRFSWRVMLMEKAGYTTFTVTDRMDQRKEWVDNNEFLTPQQEKMMSTQPDMILQYAHHLAEVYEKKGFNDPIVQCNSRVTLNGVRSQLFIDPEVDLSKQKRGFRHKEWILPQKKDQ